MFSRSRFDGVLKLVLTRKATNFAEQLRDSLAEILGQLFPLKFSA